MISLPKPAKAEFRNHPRLLTTGMTPNEDPAVFALLD
jgi:hypothetical protein